VHRLAAQAPLLLTVIVLLPVIAGIALAIRTRTRGSQQTLGPDE
jgi:hypothetical protein